MNPFVFSHIVFAVAALVALVLLVFARFERRRSGTAAYDWLVAAQVAFVLVAIPIEQLGYDFDGADNPYWMRLCALGLVLFPGLLARSICALCDRSTWGLRVSDALSVALAVGLLLSPTFPGVDRSELPPLFVVLVVGLIIEMVVATSVSIHALRRAATGQPAIVRRRARLLIGAQLVFSLTFVGWLAAPGEVASLVANWVLVVVGGLLIGALVWPRRLLQPFTPSAARDPWASFGVLMASTDVRRDLVAILDDVTDTWGLAGAAALEQDGGWIRCRGLVDCETGPPEGVREQRFSGSSATLVVWSTPLSLPFTGHDDEYLHLLAMMIHFALEREAELEQKATIAASEVAAAKSLADANERLVEADAMKSRFVSTASHELRTPLTSIIGLARTCSERWDDLDDAQLREFQDIIVEQGERLERIVDNLLTTSRIDAGMIGLAREQIELRRVIGVAVAGAGASDAVVDVAVAEDGHWVVGDEQAIYEILINLLSNAFKYGAAPFRVNVSRIGSDVEIHVEDAGPGVEPSVEGRIFERFARGAHIEQPGTGLGLSIVRDLARALDGEAGYRSGNPGSVFWVRLPAITPA